mmetsp:Transcript_89907/g.169460  ORF Transcript_89907/g.169460 Transcript_89907/m.169460 type:complete len:202 (+) Transcript_89907:507-1112(+)
MLSKSAIILSCALTLPQHLGVFFRRLSRMKACTLRRRARLTKLSSFWVAALRGSSDNIVYKSISSDSKSFCCSVFFNGSHQKEPTYTRVTSGVSITFPKFHNNAPYTRISCGDDSWSALLRTTRIFGACSFKASIICLNSSEISNLETSKSSMIASARAANHLTTPSNSYPRLSDCFSPESTPGVSIRVRPSSKGLWSLEH